MKTIYHPNHKAHDPGELHHPDFPHQNVYYSEVAWRGDLIEMALRQAKLGEIVAPVDFGLEVITAVHDPALVHFLQTAYQRMAQEAGPRPVIPETFSIRAEPAQRPRSILGEIGLYCFDTSAPIFEHTWTAAYWAAQTAVTAANHLHQTGQTTYALCRPPGHHASQSMYGGFCYLNNAAIAAQWLTEQGRRVAILDVDYHHGNGTQAIFYDRADLLFISLHADPADEYPYYWGYADERGSGTGLGYNLNLPLPFGTEEAGYLAALATGLAAIRHFAPDVLVVSLGLDTAVDDPVGGFKLQPESFARMASDIAALQLPTLIVQEGGYLLSKLGLNAVSFLQYVSFVPNCELRNAKRIHLAQQPFRNSFFAI